MLKVLIADDESLARETLKLLLANIPDVSQVYEAKSGSQALSLANKHQPDVIVLDIEMPGISGIALSKHLPKSSVIIFATAFNEYAVEAFEINAIDYILKPFDDDRFYLAFERAKEKLREEEARGFGHLRHKIEEIMSEKQASFRQRLIIKDSGRIRLIDVALINYITGAGNYAEIHLSDGKQVLHRETLTVLEQQLDPSIFIRIHRSSIVRRSYIVELHPNETGDYCVTLKNGDVLTLSRRNRAKIDELIL